MNFIEVDFEIKPYSSIAAEILYSDLEETSCDSMLETDNGYKAYFSENEFSAEIINNFPIMQNSEFNIEYKTQLIESQNWNAVWESNFSNVIIDDKINIRADHHPKDENCDFDIVINPKMSFGTAHHPTTSQILKLLLNEELSGKSVLDMGCGTAVLAIFASKAGAEKVVAIDNDEWAYKNSIENVELNNIQNIDVQLGDAQKLSSAQKFDIILANINRNILLNDISKYSESMSKGSLIFFSGFYAEDLDAIKKEAAKYSLNCLDYIVKENWVAAKFVKN